MNDPKQPETLIDLNTRMKFALDAFENWAMECAPIFTMMRASLEEIVTYWVECVNEFNIKIQPLIERWDTLDRSERMRVELYQFLAGLDYGDRATLAAMNDRLTRAGYKAARARRVQYMTWNGRGEKRGRHN